MKIKKILTLLVISLFTILLVGCLDSYHDMKCDYCGDTESCKSYTAQYIEGYNEDGSIKYGHETLWLSDDCYSKAKSSNRWVSINRLR